MTSVFVYFLEILWEFTWGTDLSRIVAAMETMKLCTSSFFDKCRYQGTTYSDLYCMLYFPFWSVREKTWKKWSVGMEENAGQKSKAIKWVLRWNKLFHHGERLTAVSSHLNLDYFALAYALNQVEQLVNNFKHFFMSIRNCKLASMNKCKYLKHKLGSASAEVTSRTPNWL